MYDDILGEEDKIRKIKNRKFKMDKKEEKEEDSEFGIYEELALEFDYE